MTPALEAMGAKVLFNETSVIARGNDQIYLAGIDDAHFYRAGDIDKAVHAIPVNTYSILLSHTPEVYREAAHRDEVARELLPALQCSAHVAKIGNCRRAKINVLTYSPNSIWRIA